MQGALWGIFSIMKSGVSVVRGILVFLRGSNVNKSKLFCLACVKYKVSAFVEVAKRAINANSKET